MSKVIVVIITSLMLLGGGRSTVHRDQLRPPPVLATATASPWPSSAPTSGPAHYGSSATCDSPPPWADLAVAEQCHPFYPPPYGQLIYVGCPAYLSRAHELQCLGYYLPPGGYVPVTPPPSPLPALPTPTPAGYPYP